MRLYVHKHRALIGYLFILAVVIGALQWHHVRTTADLEVAADRACLALEQATANQRRVLATLISMNEESLASPYLREGAAKRLPALREAFMNVPRVSCNED